MVLREWQSPRICHLLKNNDNTPDYFALLHLLCNFSACAHATERYPLNVMQAGECLVDRQQECTTSNYASGTAALPFQTEVFPFGFSVRIKSNHPSVVDIARDSWSCFKPRFSADLLELDFIISKGSEDRVLPGTVFRAQNNLLVVVADAHNSALCDLKSGVGFVHLTEATIRDESYFRYNFLESTVYTLLDVQHLVALHAACIARNGNGFLLFGDSGAGKSSLAYACAKRGLTYISDDCTFIPRRMAGRIAVGNPRTFRFRPATSALFPELEGRVSLRSGKPTIEIKSSALPWIDTATACTINHIVFLNRGSREHLTAALHPISSTECWQRISRLNAWPAELCIEQERLDALKYLAGATALQLTYTHYAEAVNMLDRLSRFDVA